MNTIILKTGSRVLAEFEIVQYSKKSVALFSTASYDIRHILSQAGGTYNPYLDYQDGKAKGYIFPKK
ncbi:MAG: hypothetical protein AAFN93_29450, partial [Bacteroidota bacterium]